MSVGVIISIAGLIITLSGVLIAFGRRDSRLDNLEARMKEDREKNNDQHAEFYKTKESVTVLGTKMETISAQLQEVKDDVKQILARLPIRNA